MVNNVIGMANEHELLKVIDFSNNHIQEISGKAFHKVSNVEKLILDHNDLSISGIRPNLPVFSISDLLFWTAFILWMFCGKKNSAGSF